MFTKSFLMFAFLVATEAHGALLGRVPLTPGSTDYQAYYDDGLDITWTRNANLAATLTPSLPNALNVAHHRHNCISGRQIGCTSGRYPAECLSP